MSDEVEQVLLEVREDASNLREYLAQVGSAAEQLKHSGETVDSAGERLNSTAEGMLNLIERVGDLVAEVMRLDPRSINDRLSRLDERLEILRGNVEELRDLKLGHGMADLQAQLRRQRTLILALLILVVGIAAMLVFQVGLTS